MEDENLKVDRMSELRKEYNEDELNDLIDSYTYKLATNPFSAILILDEKNVIPMLLYLHYNGKVTSGQIRKYVTHNNSISNKLSILHEHDLVKLERVKNKGNALYVELTDFGKEITKKLIEIEELLNSGFVTYPADDKDDKPVRQIMYTYKGLYEK